MQCTQMNITEKKLMDIHMCAYEKMRGKNISRLQHQQEVLD